jgi:hypothetical protein
VGSEKLASLVRQHRAGTITDSQFAAHIRELSDSEILAYASAVRDEHEELRGNEARLREAAQTTGTEFVRTELALGLTFSQIALAAACDQGKQLRNREYARTAYDTVLHFLPRASLGKPDAEQLQSDLEELRSNLAQLGAKV